jgi:carboxymethylenebutenolidase
MPGTNRALTLSSFLVLAMNAPQDPPTGRPQSRPSTRPAAASSGALSEQEFRALHELRKDKAPPAKGTMVEAGGERCYLSLPAGAKAPLPGVLVIHEWWGLNDHIKHWTDRLAADGYAALAVDLYGGRVAESSEDAMALMQGVDGAKAVAAMVAAHDFLVNDPRVAAPRTGVIGWCFGGTMSLNAALAIPGLDATVVYYGSGIVTDPAELKKIRGPVLGVFGDRDRSIPATRVQQFDEGLAKAGVRHEILRFDADHAFANPSNAKYDQESSARAWTRVREFLAQELRGKPVK